MSLPNQVLGGWVSSLYVPEGINMKEIFDDLEITNKCVVVCDLEHLIDGNSSTWLVIKGTEAEVGESLAKMVVKTGIDRIDDFGGVCKTFLCDDEEYLENPPRILGQAGIFSFTPRKRIVLEGMEMARVASAAGYKLIILTVQKHGKFGKTWVLSALLKSLEPCRRVLTFYEDTNFVIDELKESEWGHMVNAVHVQAPGYEDFVSKYADRVVSQRDYRDEVLA